MVECLGYANNLVNLVIIFRNQRFLIFIMYSLSYYSVNPWVILCEVNLGQSFKFKYRLGGTLANLSLKYYGQMTIVKLYRTSNYWTSNE